MVRQLAESCRTTHAEHVCPGWTVRALPRAVVRPDVPVGDHRVDGGGRARHQPSPGWVCSQRDSITRRQPAPGSGWISRTPPVSWTSSRRSGGQSRARRTELSASLPLWPRATMRYAGPGVGRLRSAGPVAADRRRPPAARRQLPGRPPHAGTNRSTDSSPLDHRHVTCCWCAHFLCPEGDLNPHAR